MGFKSAMEDEESRIRAIKSAAESGMDVKDGNISAVRGADPVYLARKLRKFGYREEILKQDLARKRHIV